MLQVEHDKEAGGGFIQILKQPSLRKRALLAIFATYVARLTPQLYASLTRFTGGLQSLQEYVSIFISKSEVLTKSLKVIGISAYLPLIFSGLGLGGALPLVMYGKVLQSLHHIVHS